jgi:hypothetical protein
MYCISDEDFKILVDFSFVKSNTSFLIASQKLLPKYLSYYLFEIAQDNLNRSEKNTSSTNLSHPRNSYAMENGLCF